MRRHGRGVWRADRGGEEVLSLSVDDEGDGEPFTDGDREPNGKHF